MKSTSNQPFWSFLFLPTSPSTRPFWPKPESSRKNPPSETPANNNTSDQTKNKNQKRRTSRSQALPGLSAMPLASFKPKPVVFASCLVPPVRGDRVLQTFRFFAKMLSAWCTLFLEKNLANSTAAGGLIHEAFQKDFSRRANMPTRCLRF